jgi:hypothetical protein
VATARNTGTVVVEGSLTPAVGHPRRGVKIEVPLTDNVKDLEARGFIFIHPSGTAPDSGAVEAPVEPVESAAPADGDGDKK